MEPANILKDVIAYVEVRSNNDNRSAAVCRELELLGAKVETSFTDDVTHVVYKEGLKRTYLKAQKKGIPLVSVSWLESCKRNQQKMPETDFTALVEKEPENSLMKLKQNRRWKKMKSMQPCDFDEEVARSAERNKKHRRRIELANRFKLAEDTTPPGGSPAMILALDTQARSSSPFFGNSSRHSSPIQSVIPDTPATPTMKERIEKMRREQKNVIGAGVESPKSSILETATLQRKLFEKLAKDIFSVGSSDEEDDGETTARVVAKLIGGLESQGDSSGISLSDAKGATDSAITMDDQMESNEKEIDNIFHSESPSNAKSNLDQSSEHGKRSRNNSRSSTPGSSRKSIVCRKENEQKIRTELVRETRHSTGSSSDDSFVLSPMCNNVVPQLVTDNCVLKQASNIDENERTLTCHTEVSSASKVTRLKASGSKDKSFSEDSTPKSSKAVHKTETQPTKPKPIKKRKLFSDPLFSMAVLQIGEEEAPSKQSPEVPTSHTKTLNDDGKHRASKAKRKRNTEAAEVSFLFSGAIGNETSKEKDTNTLRRRSKRLSVNNISGLSCSSTRNADCGNRDASTNKLVNDISTAETSSTNIQQNRHSLGTSMSILYGTDSKMLNSSLNSCSRRSLEEFSMRPLKSKNNKITSGKQCDKKNTRIPRKRTLASHDNSLEDVTERMQKSLEITNTGKKVESIPPTKKQKTDQSLSEKRSDSGSMDCKDTGSGSSSESSIERLAAPCSLRHAHSLIIENAGRGKLSLVMTSLHRHEQDTIHSIVKKLGVFRLLDIVETSTTHVVCGEPRRTLNLLRAIAGGCWILKKEWVLESLEAGTWLMEENYEMVEEFPAAKEFRLKRQNLGKMYRADLFSHIGPIHVSKDCVPPPKELVYLIMLCSGQVTNSKQRASLFLGMEHLPDKTIVKPTWVLDSIMKMSLEDPGNYIIPASSSRRENSPEF